MTNCSQEDLFPSTKKPESRFKVTLQVKGMGAIRSFKNAKRSFAWIDTKFRPPESMVHNGAVWLKKSTIRLMARPMTEKEVKAWMEKVTDLFESQLRSALATSGFTIQTAACPRSLIATLLPLNDCWTSFREVTVKSELCAPGDEGAEIVIEPL